MILNIKFYSTEALFCFHCFWTGLERIGIHRQRFVAESLRDLRKSLRATGSDLLILEGRPEDVFVKLLPRGSTIITQKVTLAMSPPIKLILAMTLTPTLTPKGGHAGGTGR